MLIDTSGQAKPELGFSLAPGFWPPLEQLSSVDNDLLLIPPSEEEIFETIRTANSNAASGPDGFSIPFFRHFWPQLKCLIKAIIRGFWLGTVDISRLSYAVLTLIPKIKGADLISQFRPIALCPVLYKIAVKAITNCLRPCMDEIISEEQSAFVPGRLITDNALLAFECLHYIQHEKNPENSYCAYKLDLSKAYDRVDWSFLERALVRWGFSELWISRVMACVSSVKYSMKFNGKLLEAFTPSRGSVKVIRCPPFSSFL